MKTMEERIETNKAISNEILKYPKFLNYCKHSRYHNFISKTPVLNILTDCSHLYLQAK